MIFVRAWVLQTRAFFLTYIMHDKMMYMRGGRIKRKQVYLTSEIDRDLKRLAAREGQTESEIISGARLNQSDTNL